METILSRASRLATLDDMKAVGNELNACVLQLGINNIAISDLTLLADTVEATFDGYAEIAAVAFGSSYVDQAGKCRINAPSVVFEMTGLTVLETVYYWMILNTAKTAIVAAAKFDTPFVLTVVSQGVPVTPTVTI